MLIKFEKIEDGYWKAVNCVSGYDISVAVDMLGDYLAIVEKKLEDGSFESYEGVFETVEAAMRWCECPCDDNPVVLETSFGA